MRKKWEYKLVTLRDLDPSQLEGVLDSYGGDGWELVTSHVRRVATTIERDLIFKRPAE